MAEDFSMVHTIPAVSTHVSNCTMVHTIPGTKLLLHDSKHSICGILSQQTGTQNKCRHLRRAVLLKQIKHSVSKAGKSRAEQNATWGLVQMQQALVQVCHKSLQINQILLVSHTTTPLGVQENK
jgi:hypothetical protein